MFAPFMPFVTEEVWSWWHEDSVHLRRWPEGETLAAAPAGDVEHDELLDLASEVLHEVRRRKSLAMVKMRAPVRRMSLVAPPGQIELLKLLSSDLRLAGEIESIELSEGESLTVEVDLGEAVGDASP
jgi:valyl-tRNA synthetase